LFAIPLFGWYVLKNERFGYIYGGENESYFPACSSPEIWESSSAEAPFDKKRK
jgi:hypothetical protein